MHSDNWLTTLAQTIRELLQADSPAITKLGLILVGGFAVVLLVRYGITTALSGRGFDFGDFFQEVIVLVATGLLLLRGYNTPLPLLADKTLPGLIIEGPRQLAADVLSESETDFFRISTQLKEKYPLTMNPFSLVGATLTTAAQFIVIVLLSAVEAALMFVIAYGYVAQAVTVLLGPIFIPFLLFPPMAFMFWAWFRALLQYAFYPLCAAGFIRIFLGLFNGIAAKYLQGDISIMEAMRLTPICLMIILCILALPVFVSSLFSGGSMGFSIKH